MAELLLDDDRKLTKELDNILEVVRFYKIRFTLEEGFSDQQEEAIDKILRSTQ